MNSNIDNYSYPVMSCWHEISISIHADYCSSCYLLGILLAVANL